MGRSPVIHPSLTPGLGLDVYPVSVSGRIGNREKDE